VNIEHRSFITMIAGCIASLVMSCLSAAEKPAPSAGIRTDSRSPIFEAGPDDALDVTDEVTLEAWIWPDAACNGRILDKSLAGSTNGYMLDTYPANCLRLITSNGWCSYTGKLPVNQWVHVAAVYSSSKRIAKLYVDGKDVPTQCKEAKQFPPLTVTEIPLLLGADSNGGSRFSGRLWRAAVYRRVLTAEEIAGRTEGRRAPEGVIADWLLDAKPGQTIRPVAGKLALRPSGAVGEEFAGEAPPPQERMCLWYRRPARQWMTEALPIGNGRMGAMVFGGVAREQVQFNEDSLWTGDENPTGDYDKMGAYQAFGNLLVDLPDHQGVANYRRDLDINEAVARVSYQRDGISYHREFFCSSPDQVLVMRFTADKPAGYSGSIRLTDTHKGRVSAVANRLTCTGAITSNGMAYESQVLVLPDGGSAQAADGKIAIDRCNGLTVLLATGTDYVPDCAKHWHGEHPHQRLVERLERAAAKGYETLRAAHVKDYQALFSRVQVDLGPAPADRQALPTDLRRKAYQAGGSDPGLENLFFQFGRYLLISCSRPGGLPANLQGLWNNSNNPPWASDYHADINVEMAYWPAEPSNLPECHLPFAEFLWNQRGAWKKATAVEKRFLLPSAPVRGWTIRYSQNITGGLGWNWYPPGSAWYCQHLWEHYAFTGDREYLKNLAYPILKEVCEFWEDHLKQLPDGRLVSPGAWSPEHGPAEDGVSHDQQLIWDLFTNYMDAADALGIDKDYRAKVAAMRDKLLGPQIGKWGQLQEWMVDRDDPKDTHRHLSHLFAVFPGRQISPITTPELAAAARKSLDARGEGGEGMAWSAAWKIGLWARLMDGDRAHRMIQSEIRHALYDNMCSAGPFQLDGAFGGPAGMCEMLLQSHIGQIHLLPALPKSWPTGSVKGLRARGGFEADISWKDGRLTAARIRSTGGINPEVRYGQQTAKLTLDTGKSIAVAADLSVR
jgi:alpha-L-fucosidase 2